MKIAVILPTYNERDNIIELLNLLTGITVKIKRHDFSFLVVDDNSPDGTERVVEDYRKSHKDVYLVTGKKEGLGKALLRGMTYAADKLRADILVQMDADLSHDPAVLLKMIAAIDNGADFVVGSRYIHGGSIPDNWSLLRKLYSILGNAIVRFGLGHPAVHDWTGGYRVYRPKYFELARDELAKYRGYVFQIAFLHKSILNGAKVVEVPFHFTDRRYGHSKIVPSQYIKDILWYISRARLKEILSGPFLKFCIVGSIGFIINTAVLEIMVQWGLHPAIGSMMGAELAIISNFLLNNAWTFGHRRIYGSRVLGKFLQFNTTSLGAILLQGGTVAVGSFFWGVGYYRLYYILGVGLGLIWNYTMYSRVIWKK